MRVYPVLCAWHKGLYVIRFEKFPHFLSICPKCLKEWKSGEWDRKRKLLPSVAQQKAVPWSGITSLEGRLADIFSNFYICQPQQIMVSVAELASPKCRPERAIS